jgi:RND family efflux transporter MFP subunit
MPEYVIIRSDEETMFSSETTGQIILLPVKDGSAFNKGDILLKLDCRLQEAELAKARAEQDATSKAMESAKKLKGYGSISEFEYVKTKSEADAANANVQKLKVTVEKCTIIAPFSGGVADVKVNLYETVKPGDPLIKVVNTENLTFEVQVPSQWLSWLHIDSPFSVRINDINKTIPAKVTLINPEIEPISQTVKIVGVISPSNPWLRPGMTGQAIFDDNPEKYKKE